MGVHDTDVTLPSHKIAGFIEPDVAPQEETLEDLGCGDLLLTDAGVDTLMARLYLWRDLIRSHKKHEAAELQAKLSFIADYTVIPKLSQIYGMFEVMDLLTDGNLSAAERKLRDFEEHLIGASGLDAEVSYYYWRNKGSLKSFLGCYEEALDCFLKALDLGEENNEFLKTDGGIYVNTTACYTYLYLPFQAITFIQRIRDSYSDKKGLGLYLDNTLAVNYIRLGDIRQAKKLLDKCLERAEADESKLGIGIVLHNYGLFFKKKGEWREAISRFDKAFDCFQRGSGHYIENTYQKARCLTQLGEFSEAKALLKQAGTFNNTSEKHSIILKSLYFLMDLGESTDGRKSEALNYIRAVTIPYLVDAYEYSKAIDYAEILLKHYGELNNQSDYLEVCDVIIGVYKK